MRRIASVAVAAVVAVASAVVAAAAVVAAESTCGSFSAAERCCMQSGP